MLPRGATLVGKLRPPAPFYILGQGAHGVPGDFHAFAAINRSFRDIDSGQDFGAAAFAFDPERHCGLYGILGPLKSAACDGLSDEILLLGREVYLHAANVTGSV
jgi:hypothetical protein